MYESLYSYPLIEFKWCIIVYLEFCNKKVWTTLQLHTFEFCNKEVWCCCSNCCQQPTVQPQLLVCQSLRQTTIKQITVKITRKQESRTLVNINIYPPSCAWIQEPEEISSCCVSTQISKLSRQFIFFCIKWNFSCCKFLLSQHAKDMAAKSWINNQTPSSPFYFPSFDTDS